jgi:aldose 1-epimerase
VTVARFGTLPDGRPVERFTICNGSITLHAIELGAVITSLMTPDRRGASGDIVLGFDTLDGYLDSSPYFGAVVGRFANRIARGRFVLDGVHYQLACNNGENHLHGGVRGFDKALWNGQPITESGEPGVAFSYVSEHGEEGYPGQLQVSVTYVLTATGELRIRYTARCDRPTIINLSQHSYFNLSASAADVLDHMLTLHASRFTPVDDGLIPTGKLRGVDETPFDFRTPASIGARISVQDDQLAVAGGYDHNFVLDRRTERALELAARVTEPMTGRTLEVRTTQPGLQFYSGNFLDGSIIGKGGRRYAHRSGFCLETQHYPDSPNQPGFPSVLLRSTEQYVEETTYVFGAE